MTSRRALRFAILYFFAFLLFLFTVAPVAWLVIMSVSPASDLVTVPLRWWPSSLDLTRYASVLLEDGLFLAALRNSVIAAGLGTLLAMAVAIPAAYAFARRRAPIAILFLILGTFMIPPIVYVLPLYETLGGVGLLDTRTGLVIVYTAFLLPYAVWLAKSAIDALPVATEEAAMLDGAGTLTILVRIILPTARPALMATALLSFLTAWDEFFYALILTGSTKAKTLPVAIADFASGRVTDYGMVSTVGVLAAILPIVLALLFQRSLIAGLSAGSVKG
ncbi:carbohydrate ABC transporter membrane protein 2, CUT1 family [Arboricoccus pini]|uniref:Carbohydrate ABC transporter membrane protein 2, CUT1 family n=1 Tax=Arboricoccus pini TaxID=1963835 RepID=A0A212RNE6_9PROT|nr:carbohydrate ABC transporter permease [Arboricoccus pini]SNB74051.1 carbohydrate ABC transporter membrane protein 2, CUT1 family [Arboricoccus pini]